MVRMRHIGMGWAYLILCSFFGASSAFGQIEQKLVAFDSLAGAGYGRSVAMSDNFVIVGSPTHAPAPSDFINGPLADQQDALIMRTGSCEIILNILSAMVFRIEDQTYYGPHSPHTEAASRYIRQSSD